MSSTMNPTTIHPVVSSSTNTLNNIYSALSSRPDVLSTFNTILARNDISKNEKLLCIENLLKNSNFKYPVESKSPKAMVFNKITPNVTCNASTMDIEEIDNQPNKKRKTSLSKLQPMIDEIKSWSNSPKKSPANDATTEALTYFKSSNRTLQYSQYASYSSSISSRSSSGNSSPVNGLIFSKSSSSSPIISQSRDVSFNPENSAFGAFRRLCN